MSVGDGEKHDSRVSEDEFCDYVRNRRSVLLGMAIGLTGHRADAEDLLQARRWMVTCAGRWSTRKSPGGVVVG
jgi:hypothetical protein